MTLRSRLDRVATAPIAAPLLRPLQQGVGVIFMLHRMADPDLGVQGHDPQLLARCLEFLRRGRFRVRHALDLIHSAVAGEDISRSVAFTVDDGQIDFDTVGAPVFQRYDTPVTVFVTTGVVDGNGWFWWNRIQAASERTSRPYHTFSVGDHPLALRFDGNEGRRVSAEAVMKRLKPFAPSEVRAMVDRYCDELGVELPEHPGRSFSVMGWDTIRKHARAGVAFGPHTVTHPILSRVSAARAEEEISDSWRRLGEELGEDAVPLFCYPNGEPGDYTREHWDALGRAGLSAAVKAGGGYVRQMQDGASLNRFAVPRFAFPDTLHHFKSIVLGVERLVGRVRRVLPRLGGR